MTVPKNLIHARDRYLAKGIPSGGAIALASVLYYESRLDPGSQGYQPTETPGVLNPHGAYGIPSLNGPRQKDLLDYATAHNLPVDSLDTQLDFVLNEIANSYPKSWAAIRSSASYHSIVPIIVDEYENPKDKPKEIEGALVIAADLAALPAQQAPPAPLPQVPAPKVPPIIPPVPPAPTGLPPISPSGAGRRAAVLDNLGAMRDAIVDEIAGLNAELAILDTTISDFGKLSPMIIPAALPKPAHKPAEPQTPTKPQRTTMNPQVSQTLRGILLSLGASAVTKGVISQDTLVSLVGVAMGAVSYGWSWLSHTTTGTIAAAAALPEVQKIIAPPSIADSTTFAANPKVVSH